MISFLILLLLPLVSLLFLPLKPHKRNWFYGIMFLFSLASIIIAFSIKVNTCICIQFIALSLKVDSLSKIFLILISCSWLLSILYTYEFTKYHFQKRKTVFFICLNTLLSVVMVNACADNMSTLFIFYVIGIPLTYPLITLRDNEEAIVAAKIFLKQTLLPSFLLFLPAIIVTKHLIGHVSFSENSTFQSNHIDPIIGGLILALFITGISKNSVFPFHLWLPSTGFAPAPVSALVHSVATVKTGSIALIKISTHIFGLNYIHVLTSNFITGGWLIYLCGLTAIYTAYKALVNDDLKRRLAFSTVGQLSYILLAILFGTRTGIMAASLHIVTHAVAKSCLFYVAGYYNNFYNTTSIKQIGKIMPSTPFLAVVILICGLSITGFPFLAGYYSKDLMLIEAWHSHYYPAAIFLLLGSIINLVYIIGPVKNVFHLKNPSIAVAKIPLGMMLTFIISLLLILGCNFYISFLTVSFN